MLTKAVQHGEQYYLPIKRELVEAMAIDLDTPLDARVERGHLVISRAQIGLSREEVSRSVAEICARYGEALRRLAD